MKVLRTKTVTAHSPVSWEDGVQKAIHEASQKFMHIHSVIVKDFSVSLNGEIVEEYLAKVKIVFEIE